jgi:hypothetical protein
MAKRFQLVVFNTRLNDWTVKRHVSAAKGFELCAQEKAEAIYGDDEELVGFSLKSDMRAACGVTRPTPERYKLIPGGMPDVNLTLEEMDLIAGQAFEQGKSRTLTLTKTQRIVRDMRGQLTEDSVHLAVVKAASYFGARCVYA